MKAGELKAIEEKLEVIEEQVDEEWGKDEVTIGVFGENTNFKDPSIEVEIDYPSKYEDKKMPILDIKLAMKSKIVRCFPAPLSATTE